MNSTCCIRGTNGSILMSSLANIKETNNSRLIGAPVESGKTEFDNKVIMPLSVEVTGTVTVVNLTAENGENEQRDYHSILVALYKMFNDRSYNTYTIVSKHSIMRNMICENLEIVNTSEKYDVVDVNITFKELMISKAAYKETKPVRVDDLPTIDSGNKGTSSYGKTLSSGYGGVLHQTF